MSSNLFNSRYTEYNKRWAEMKSQSTDFEQVWDSPLLDDNKDELRRIIHRTVEGPVITESSVYQCLKCGSRLVTASKLQNRSADEETAIKLKCHGCQNMWNA